MYARSEQRCTQIQCNVSKGTEVVSVDGCTFEEIRFCRPGDIENQLGGRGALAQYTQAVSVSGKSFFKKKRE